MLFGLSRPIILEPAAPINPELKAALHAQISEFKTREGASIDDLTFYTLQGADCLRFTVQTPGNFMDFGYAPAEYGYAGYSQMARSIEAHMQAQEHIKKGMPPRTPLGLSCD